MLPDAASCSRGGVTSYTAGTNQVLAATRGIIDLAELGCADTMWVKGEFCDKSFSKSGDTIFRKRVPYCGDAE